MPPAPDPAPIDLTEVAADDVLLDQLGLMPLPVRVTVLGQHNQELASLMLVWRRSVETTEPVPDSPHAAEHADMMARWAQHQERHIRWRRRWCWLPRSVRRRFSWWLP